MTARRFSLKAIRDAAQAAIAALRPPEPVVFEDYPPFRPTRSVLVPDEPLALGDEPDGARGHGIVRAAVGVSAAVHAALLAYALTHTVLPSQPSPPQAAARLAVELVDGREFEMRLAGKAAVGAPGVASKPVEVATTPDPTTTAALPGEARPPAPAVSLQMLAVPVQEKAAAVQEKLAAAVPVEVLLDAPALQEAALPVLATPNAAAGETVAPAQPDARLAAATIEPEPDTQGQTPAQLTAQAEPSPVPYLPPQHNRARRTAPSKPVISGGSGSGGGGASRGVVAAYTNRVQSHLTVNRPSGGRGSGTVRITFALSASGRVIWAHVSRPSGKPVLDQAALMAVRAASPYPMPPTNLTAAQRTFSFPFFFQ